MDCRDQFANWFAMTLLLQGVRWAAGHMGPALHYSYFVGQGPCALPGVREKPGRADVGIGPYGALQEVRCGIPQSRFRRASPL